MEKIEQVDGMYISPFFQFYLENKIYYLKNFSNKKLIEWKNRSSNSESFKILERLQAMLGQDILLDKNSYLFEKRLRAAINQNYRSDISKSTIVNQLLKNLHNYIVNFIVLKGNAIDKQRLFCTNKNSQNEFNIILLLGGEWRINQLKQFMAKSQCILFTRKIANTYMVGPFLNKTHLLNKNLDIISKYPQTQVVDFLEEDILRLGLRPFVERQWEYAIVEYFSKYLYQSSPLYNRQLSANPNGMVAISDLLPLY